MGNSALLPTTSIAKAMLNAEDTSQEKDNLKPKRQTPELDEVVFGLPIMVKIGQALITAKIKQAAMQTPTLMVGVYLASKTDALIDRVGKNLPPKYRETAKCITGAALTTFVEVAAAQFFALDLTLKAAVLSSSIAYGMSRALR
jgi:hypothetical protein